MQSVKTQNKVIAFMMTMALAIACSLAIAPAAFANLVAGDSVNSTVAWNPNVTVTAMGGNGTYTIDSTTHTATITENSTKTENGQYVHVVMQFASTADLSGVQNEDARTYLQANTTIAGRDLNGVAYSTYKRDVFNAVVNNTAKTITFDISYNTAGTTANYNGKLNIAANSTSNATIATAMGAPVETLIGTGVTISNNDGVLSNDGKTKTFTITSAAKNRGMVHVLIMDGDSAIFNGTGTFSNGGLTVHAHTFITQDESSFASLIATAGQDIVDEAADEIPSVVIPYSFDDNAGSFSVTSTAASGSCSNVRAYIYDCSYLNTIHGAVGDIYEDEIQNS